ncbi:uncharacterized protein L203_104565 [Cryptococcus depauperatus CBS 7841]|uniref:STB6-like N-terminal domain-containing protein n=1 Tax=Cryptococcus depauperatus CBS 7841 TaxID=1295531 RepID=A0A1E3ILP7_9TREE|nr:hypothetical protein L203_02235 [Cryptococcus depauperatus CBS 7841]
MSYTLSPTNISPISNAASPSTPANRFISSATPSPSPHQSSSSYVLLIPTDRSIHELKTKWISRLGRLRVDKEVVLKGYALYSLRSWFLSRTHFSHTIVTRTGKPNEQISVYCLVPASELSEQEGALEITTAIRFLAAESRSQPQKTELGTLLVTTPSAFGQDVNPVPGGDFRIAKPYIIVNTGLRRLGCGGRAILGFELPIPALRRKFHDLYRIPVPTHTIPTASRTNSPTTSPTRPRSFSTPPQAQILSSSPINRVHEEIIGDPFTYLVVELVKLIQASLALWGMFDDLDGEGNKMEGGNSVSESDMEIDGLFCDETKAAIFNWRRIMGMEHEESLKLEKETSGGCIDPKTLASLLSSVTSIHYLLDSLDIERLPKDPFASIRKTLKAWMSYQILYKCPDPSPFLSVPSIKTLARHYMTNRRHTGDGLRVQRLLYEVAHTASNLSANLKGVAEDTPLRRREHHLRQLDLTRFEDEASGVEMIVPEGEVGMIAPPNVITSDLEAYIRGILRSREKDWDVIGARRVAELWNGTVADSVDGYKKRRGMLSFGLASRARSGSREREKGVLRRRTTSKDESIQDDDEGDLRGTIRDLGERAGQAFKEGLGIMSRKSALHETSDSETGVGLVPSTLRTVLLRKKHDNVPTLVEPEPAGAVLSNSPSPSNSNRNQLPNANQSVSLHGNKLSFLGSGSRALSRVPSAVHPPTIHMPFGNDSDIWSRLSLRGKSPGDERSDFDWGQSHGRANGAGNYLGAKALLAEGTASASRAPPDGSITRRNRGRFPIMPRSNSDGADITFDESDKQWEISTLRGTGKRRGNELNRGVSRRRSFNDLCDYPDMRVLSAEKLEIDVEMCAVIMELRATEQKLAQKAKDAKMLEEAVYNAILTIGQSSRARRTQVDTLMAQANSLRESLETLEIDEDPEEALPYDRFHYYLSEETHRSELLDDLGRVKEMWEEVRREGAERRQKMDRKEVKRGWTWWSW